MKGFIILGLFLLFYILFFAKAILQKNKSKASTIVLVKKNKEKSTNIIQALLAFELLYYIAVVLIEVINPALIFKLFEGNITDLTGIGIISAGIILFIIAMFTMKSSWRVGIDSDNEPDLVEGGIYKISRNPAFLGADFMSIGLFIACPDILTLINMLLWIIIIHLQILQKKNILMINWVINISVIKIKPEDI